MYLHQVIKKEIIIIIMFAWFKNNGLKANPKKSHLLLNCNDTDKSALIENNQIFNENYF